MAQGNAKAKLAVSDLEENAAKMMGELDGLVGKIRELSKGSPDDMKDAAVAALGEQMKALQGKLGTLVKDHEETLAKIDKQVRANPYLFIACALGLGVLLGKAMRS